METEFLGTDVAPRPGGPRLPLLAELESLYIRRYVLDKVIRRLEDYERSRRRQWPVIGIDAFLPNLTPDREGSDKQGMETGLGHPVEPRDPAPCFYCGQATRSLCDACQRFVCAQDECRSMHDDECEQPEE